MIAKAIGEKLVTRYPRRYLRPALQRGLGDVLMVNAALLTAFAARFVGLVWIKETHPEGWANDLLRDSAFTYLVAAPIVTVLCLTIFFVSGFYTYGRLYRGRYRWLVIAQAVSLAYAVFGAMMYLFFDVAGWFPRTVWFGAWLLTIAFVSGLRVWSAAWRKTVWTEANVWGKPAPLKVRNVLVIGAAGYVGSELVRQLLDRGYSVTAMDAMVYGEDSIKDLYERPGFSVLRGDLRDIEAVIRGLQYADAVVHLGAVVGDPACDLDEHLTHEINLMATRMVAEVAKAFGIQRFVFASTCSVYGAGQGILNESSPLNPASLYARTKMECEEALLKMEDESFAPTILRFGTFYGLSPRRRFDLVVNLLAAKAVTEGRITIQGGEQWRPFVHVDDGCGAIVKTLEAQLGDVHGEIFNVGSDEQNFQIDDIGKFIKGLMPEVEVVRQPLTQGAADYHVSFEKIRRVLDFTPSRDLTDSIKEIQELIEAGQVPDYQDSKYSNHKALLELKDSALRASSESSALSFAGTTASERKG